MISAWWLVLLPIAFFIGLVWGLNARPPMDHDEIQRHQDRFIP